MAGVFEAPVEFGLQALPEAVPIGSQDEVPRHRRSRHNSARKQIAWYHSERSVALGGISRTSSGTTKPRFSDFTRVLRTWVSPRHRRRVRTIVAPSVTSAAVISTPGTTSTNSNGLYPALVAQQFGATQLGVVSIRARDDRHDRRTHPAPAGGCRSAARERRHQRHGRRRLGRADARRGARELDGMLRPSRSWMPNARPSLSACATSPRWISIF